VKRFNRALDFLSDWMFPACLVAIAVFLVWFVWNLDDIVTWLIKP